MSGFRRTPFAMTEPVVHVVHCVDTEGPLHESLEATFARLKDLFGLDLAPDAARLAKLQRREIDLGGFEDAVARVVDRRLLAYNDTWESIDRMLDRIMSPQYRSAQRDSFGRGWIFNWHCLDHVGYVDNPRRRDLGYHKVFDRYRARLAEQPESGDSIHFHHHPVAFSRAAHHSATHMFSPQSELFQVLARRIIDRHWFPCVYRPGFHAERPDSNWFLEQYIPFDFANQRIEVADVHQADAASGRFGDWRRAPKTWQPYHPDHDDYQREGACRRWIARCLNIGTRHHLLGEDDVDQAFVEAREGKPVVLAITNHDHRDMTKDIDSVRDMLSRASARHPAVRYRFGEARDAMRWALGLDPGAPVAFDCRLNGTTLRVAADRPTFGPQPFLAIKTRDDRYLHDNFDFQTPFQAWSYEFDEMTIPLADVSAIGLGTCDPAGNVSTVVIEPVSGKKVVTIA